MRIGIFLYLEYQLTYQLNGKPSINKAWNGFMNFIETVFDEDGKYRDIDYFTNKGKPCDWCEFKQRGICSAWS